MNKALAYQEPAGIKLGANIPPLATDEELRFLSQLGLEYCYTWLEDEQLNYDFIAGLRERAARYGLTLHNAGNLTLGKSAAIHLGLPERDRHIERFGDFLHTLSRAGVHTTTITWEPNGTLSTSPSDGVTTAFHGVARGGAPARMVDMAVMDKWGPSHGRVYRKEETWENFTYFAKRVVPVAEEAKVRISLHPNDPPVPMVGGIATLIENRDDYRRAFAIADSDFFGMEFCCGCWLEGGKGFGDILDGIAEFVAAGKVFIVHFRNVTGPLPCFTETFIDEGYQDMQAIMTAFVRAGYNGTLVMDHSPELIGGRYAQTAYATGYLKALLHAAEREAARG